MKLRLRWTLLIATAVIALGVVTCYFIIAFDPAWLATSNTAASTRGRSQPTPNSAADAPIVHVGESATLEEVLAAWEAAGARLRSYDVYIQVEDKTLLDINGVPRAEPLINRSSSHQLFSSGRRRIESDVAQPGQQPTYIAIWDGRRAISHSLVQNQISVAKSFEAPAIGDYDALFRLAHGTSLWIDMLRERADTKLIDREDGQFVVYTPTTLGKRYDYSPYGLRFWLDSDRGCMPVQSQFLYPVSGIDIINMEIESQLKEVATGVWAPITAIARLRSTVGQELSPPPVHTERRWTIDLEHSTFNIDIPDSMFELDPP